MWAQDIVADMKSPLTPNNDAISMDQGGWGCSMADIYYEHVLI